MFGLLESALEVAQAVNPELGQRTVRHGGQGSQHVRLPEEEPRCEEEETESNEKAQITAAYIIGRLDRDK